jgi:hypothetical protein
MKGKAMIFENLFKKKVARKVKEANLDLPFDPENINIMAQLTLFHDVSNPEQHGLCFEGSVADGVEVISMFIAQTAKEHNIDIRDMLIDISETAIRNYAASRQVTENYCNCPKCKEDKAKQGVLKTLNNIASTFASKNPEQN